MLFMVIEHFDSNDMIPTYRRLRNGGRALPPGLVYHQSWIEPNFAQLLPADGMR